MKPITIHNLVCKAHLEMASVCLYSLYDFMAETFELIIHDDGSLDDQDVALLSQRLPKAKVILRHEADKLLDDFLSQYPMLKKAREKMPYFLKLIDINLIKKDELTCFVDSDVLFLRPFSGAFTLPESDVNTVFMKDIRNCYKLRGKHLWPLGPLKLVTNLNSGMFCVKQNMIDYDFLEQICQRCGLEEIFSEGGWFEQGLWSALAHRLKCRLYNPQQILTAEARLIPDNPIALHFNGPSRHKLQEYLVRKLPSPQTTEKIQFISTFNYSLFNYTIEAINFRSQRLITRVLPSLSH